jgi:putative membrane protein
MKPILLAIALTVAPASLAVAQVTAPAAPTASTSMERFQQQVMISDTFEMESSRMALEKSRSTAVQQFARTMINDHGRTSAKLKELTTGSTTGRTTAPAEQMPGMLDTRHRAMLDQLSAASGPTFDQMYVQLQIQAHEEAVTLFSAYAQNGTDPSLRSFAAQTLPTLEAHLTAARALANQVR